MSDAMKTMSAFKKASKLSRMAFRKNGPKCFKRGQGALMNALVDGEKTQRELVVILGVNRGELKSIVKKAHRNGYVDMQECDEPRTYKVVLTEPGKALAEKRAAANEAVAADILSCLTDEEQAQFAALNEKIIVSLKEKGINAKKKGYKSQA